jgi:hypothetical protein
MSGLTRQNSTVVSNAGGASQDKRLQLAIAKAELLALKKDLRLKESVKKQQKEDNDFAIKHSTVIKHIKLKNIALQWINNTYDIISMKQQRLLKKDAWAQCISPVVTPDPFLIQNPDREGIDCLWKPEFKIFANGEWFPHDDPITPPTSPQKNKKGKVFSFGEEIEVAQRDGLLQVEKGLPIAEFDGPRMTNEKAFADMIELWFNLKYTSGRKVYTEFWKEEKIKLFKNMGLFNSFGDMMEDALDRYADGEKVRFLSSKNPFNMDSTLEKHMDIMLNQYKKHRRTQGLNVNAKPFVPSFQ